MNNFSIHYEEYSGDCHRLLEKYRCAMAIGDEEEARRLLNEELYKVFFNQKEHLKCVYKAIIKIDGLDKVEPGRKIIQCIEEAIKRNNEFLCNWSDDLEESLNNFNKIYVSLLNQGESN